MFNASEDYFLENEPMVGLYARKLIQWYLFLINKNFFWEKKNF